jgi:uncharacterized protein YjdB
MPITSPPLTLAAGQTVNIAVQPVETDGKTPSGGTMSGLNWNSSNTNVASPGTAANPDGSVPVTINQAGTAILTSAATVTDTNGAVLQDATGQVTVTVTADPLTAGLLMTLKAS